MSTEKMERRILQGKISLRAAAPGSDSPGTLDGLAAVYNSWSQDLNGFKEKLLPGAFDQVLSSAPDVRALLNHDPNFVLGRTTNGTLKLAAVRAGLYCSVDLPNTQTARDLHTLISRGDISQMSFAFKLDDGDDAWGEDAQDENGKPYRSRTIRNVSRLFDVSFVTTPAYADTIAAARALRSHYVIATPAVRLVDESDRDWIRRENARKVGAQIAADDRAAYQAEVDTFNRPHMTHPWRRHHIVNQQGEK
ncbi:MAG TPA: HK97 family phage prohead protease [Candidatus Acidoferrales bacterium]|nr:HK97 family phage prohead protease [Candidatus Acidoferrales bacterium]